MPSSSPRALARKRAKCRARSSRCAPSRASSDASSRSSLSSRSSAILDLDNDGDLDIVYLDFNDRPQVLISNLADRRPIHYLKLQLIGRRSNRDGLGATIKVRAGGHNWTQYHDGKSGYLAQSSIPLYFGLADADKVDSVEVVWPSGIKQTVQPATADTLLTITELNEENRP